MSCGDVRGDTEADVCMIIRKGARGCECGFDEFGSWECLLTEGLEAAA